MLPCECKAGCLSETVCFMLCTDVVFFISKRIHESTWPGDVIKYREVKNLLFELQQSSKLKTSAPWLLHIIPKTFHFSKRKETLLSYFSFSYQMLLFWANIFTLRGGKCLVQTTLIWSHTAFRRTYFIVFIYYNDMYTSFLPLFCSTHKANENLYI